MKIFTPAPAVRIPEAIMGCGLACLLLFSPARAASDQTEATTPQQAVTKVCAACHGIQIVLDTPKDYDTWHDTVQTMIDRGAQGTPDELDLVMQYLFENMTTVDVNHADADTLGAVLHASPPAVASIMAHRQTRPFKDLSDLEAVVPGLDRKALEVKKRMIFFQ